MSHVLCLLKKPSLGNKSNLCLLPIRQSSSPPATTEYRSLTRHLHHTVYGNLFSYELQLLAESHLISPSQTSLGLLRIPPSIRILKSPLQQRSYIIYMPPFPRTQCTGIATKRQQYGDESLRYLHSISTHAPKTAITVF